MAKVPFFSSRFSPDGLTSDIDYLSPARKGLVDDALNIHYVTQGGITTGSVENVLGNEFAFLLPTVTTQNKVFRVYFDVTQLVPTARVLVLFNGNGVNLGAATYTPTNANLAQTRTDFITAINGTGVTATVGALVTTVANATGYVSLEITDIPFWDYSIVLTGAISERLPIITQEAIDASLAGKCFAIGSYNVDGDVMLWSTPQKNLPEELAITNAVDNGAGLIRITVADTSHILNGAMVKISGVLGTTEANGLWIVTVISATTFDLQGSVFTNAYVSGGVATLNIGGVGEIGVAQKDFNSSTWNYTTLLRSREFNFRTKNQIDAVCERNDLQLNCYWCDGNHPSANPYRRFYYQGAYMTNGALNFINPLGLYFYGTIYNETRLFQGNGLADILYSDQLQSGGALYAGNYRYVVRFLDEFFNPTLWTDPSGIFVVSKNSLTPNILAVAENVYGNASTDQTSKINQMLLSGIVPNLFKYYELGALFYVDGTPVPIATIVKRELLNQTPTQIIQHTGNETNVQSFDINTLLSVAPDILTGLNIDIIANRLVPSNTTSHATFDFSAWVDTFKYNLLKENNSEGIITGIQSRVDGTLKVGEYETSVNTFNKLSFMFNETYRLSCKFELLNGAFTDNFWFDDIKIDDQNPSVGKRNNVLPSMNLTNSNATQVYIAFLQIINIDWLFSINGVQMKDVVKRIHWEMVEMTDQFREVLADGVIAMSANLLPNTGVVADSAWMDVDQFNFYYHQFSATIGDFLDPDIDDNMDYLFIEGEYVDTTNQATSNPPYQNYSHLDPFLGTQQNININRNYCSFYSSDIFLNKTSIGILSGDQLITFDQPSTAIINGVNQGTTPPATPSNNPLIINGLKEFSGFTNIAPSAINITEGIYLSEGQRAQVGTGAFYTKKFFIEHIDVNDITKAADSTHYNPSSLVLHMAAPITKTSAFTDYALYKGQYFRAKIDKFGNPTGSKYVPTGWTTENLQITTNVFGDVYNQKNWFQHRRAVAFENPEAGNNDLKDQSGNKFVLPAYGGGIGYYSQCRANGSMTNKSASSNAWKYQSITEGNWLSPINASFFLSYNSGYDSQQGVSSDIAFDINLPKAAATPARFWWSLNKPENSIADLYTVILPLNFRDLDLTHSEIYEGMNVNGNLMTLQNRHFEMQYFDNTGLVNSSSATVVFGSSGVASQRGSTLSTYGTKHKWSVIKGKSAGGKETIYWINTENGKAMRFEPSDGTVCISDLQDMRWFFKNKLRFADLAFTPADGEGICGGWDDYHGEAVWTVRAHKQLPAFDTTGATVYNIGDEVFYQPSIFSTFEQTGEIYVSLINNNIALPTNTSAWRIVSHEDINYYNEYTIAYSEVKKKFVTRYSFLPKIYLDWPTLLTPRPVENENFIYEHYTSNSQYCTWYVDATAVSSDVEQSVDGFISGMVVNENQNTNKHFMAVEMMTEIIPKRMEFFTKQYNTFIEDTDFEPRFDYFISYIKNDLVGGKNDTDTPISGMSGSYISSKLVFERKVYQKLFNGIMKCLIKWRTPNT